MMQETVNAEIWLGTDYIYAVGLKILTGIRRGYVQKELCRMGLNGIAN